MLLFMCIIDWSPLVYLTANKLNTQGGARQAPLCCLSDNSLFPKNRRRLLSRRMAFFSWKLNEWKLTKRNNESQKIKIKQTNKKNPTTKPQETENKSL